MQEESQHADRLNYIREQLNQQIDWLAYGDDQYRINRVFQNTLVDLITELRRKELSESRSSTKDLNG